MSTPKRVILLVDDAEFARSVTKLTLETWRYRVIAVSTREALTAFAQEGCDVALVKAERESPETLGGIEVTAALKELSPATPAILFSRQWKGYHQHPANAFLAKGFTTAELLEAIRALLGKRRGPKRAAAAVYQVDERLRA